MQRGQKVLIIGWDGATWDYIDPLLEAGALPNLQRLLRQGVRATLRSTKPPYTNVAWPSMVTGMGPAKTGIFDGGRLESGTYRFVPASAAGYRGIPIWHWANRYGKRAGVLNVPTTYPAAPLQGFMVTGFDSPRNAPETAFPRNLLTRWRDLGRHYQTLHDEINLIDHQNPHHQRMAIDAFANQWECLTREQGEMVRWLWEEDPVDLMFVVFSSTDSINHRTNETDYISQVYQACDAALGRMLEGLDAQTLVCLVSDHGSIPARRYISLNRIFHDAGWIMFESRVAPRFFERLPGWSGDILARMWQRLPKALQSILSWLPLRLDPRLVTDYENIDWSHTQVFARTGLGPLYLNVQGRHPEGAVVVQDYQVFREGVRSGFLNLKDAAGMPLFSHVWRTEDLYGQLIPGDVPPDLLLEPRQWSDHLITGYPSDQMVREIPRERPYGTHTPDGIFLLSGPGLREGLDLGIADIIDVVPTVLAAWGCPVPAEVDGRVLEAGFAVPPDVRWEESDGMTVAASHAEADEREIVARMRDLGYME